MVSDLPIASELRSNRFLHKRLLMITTGVPRYRSSSGENSRPRVTSVPRVLKNPEETSFPLRCSGVPGPAKSTPCALNAAICWNERALRCQSRKLGYETHVRGKRGLFSQTITKRSGLAYCNGANTTPCITLNIAVLAPMPRVIVSTATAVKPGDLDNMRKLKRKS